MSSQISFGERVRVSRTPETSDRRIAGLVGTVHDETTPSLTAVEVIGDTSDDYAVSVYFAEFDDAYWIAPSLLTFVNSPGATEKDKGGISAAIDTGRFVYGIFGLAKFGLLFIGFVVGGLFFLDTVTRAITITTLSAMVFVTLVWKWAHRPPRTVYCDRCKHDMALHRKPRAWDPEASSFYECRIPGCGCKWARPLA